MSNKTDKSVQFYFKAKDLFESLRLPDWEIDDGFKKKGGQATVLALKNSNGSKGVFRSLISQDETSKKRFFKELEILTDPRFKHPNIVNILAYTKDEKHQWYISERGKSFDDFWKNQRKAFQDDPEGLVNSAIEVIKQICNGLEVLHENGVVHRDIKPGNLIVLAEKSEKYPVLIDFGVVYVDFGDERITSVEDAVGNVRYSPDVMMNRIGEIRPWLDIFELAQLLIWMVQIAPVKNWTRPLDWRWVNYDERLSDKTTLSLRAISALCSDERTMPQNAKELSELIAELIPGKPSIEQIDFTINIENINSGIAKGKAKKSIKLTKDLKMLDASYVVAKKFYGDLHKELEEIALNLQKQIENVGKFDIDFESFYKALSEKRDPSENLFTLRFPERSEPFFAVTIRCSVFLPSLKSNADLPDTSNIFLFSLTRHSSVHKDALRSVQKLTLERDGKISLREENMSFIKHVSILEVATLVKELIEDPEPWELIHENLKT